MPSNVAIFLEGVPICLIHQIVLVINIMNTKEQITRNTLTANKHKPPLSTLDAFILITSAGR
eukprot:8608951-Ditylum_brightwellii.AAC.1